MVSSRGVFARSVAIAIRDLLSVSCQKESCAARMLRCCCIDDALTWACAEDERAGVDHMGVFVVMSLWGDGRVIR